ncbi:hypothetical protein L249_0642 [Ophiocordyceps polyrhachis-furcata BCC 54312]|uniref:U3 small nucleolar RNA-associated protein 11 n=1 Tax=Ophiocordyceps polyrhachis-furcata BCC 54312 TaxID=1330021 RepID=A0A367LFF9_9HYPO|nr:hypothetical protein L249_0642 [Ophiocordyceps polyrhachis-furcata BCC 54312]
MSASMRNALQRRPHRERAQPHERRRLGLLEKHKDYALRAQDYNKKQAQLKALRQKAADRNEDEFYFGMMSRKGPGSRIMDGPSWRGTVAGDRGNKVLSVETVRLLKTQDMGYIRTMRRVLAKEVSRLEQQIVVSRTVCAATASHPRKIIFADTVEERSQAVGAAEAEAQHGDDDDDDDNDDHNHNTAESEPSLEQQLQNARKKLQALTDAEDELDVQRAKMAKTATSGGETKQGHKIKVRARKR